MDESFPPRVSCIYQIRCIPTGQIYVGSATSLRLRWDQYRLARRLELLRVEQAWLDSTRCWDRRAGFNVFRLAGSPGDMLARTWKGFVDPAGNSVTILNLFDFCQQRGLDFPSMHRLAKGRSKLKSHKGWTHENSIRQRDYIKTHTGFVDPHGNIVGMIVNLAAFCRKNGLEVVHMHEIKSGRRRSHKGWTWQVRR